MANLFLPFGDTRTAVAQTVQTAEAVRRVRAPLRQQASSLCHHVNLRHIERQVDAHQWMGHHIITAVYYKFISTSR
jgi:hypothetical protein